MTPETAVYTGKYAWAYLWYVLGQRIDVTDSSVVFVRRLSSVVIRRRVELSILWSNCIILMNEQNKIKWLTRRVVAVCRGGGWWGSRWDGGYRLSPLIMLQEHGFRIVCWGWTLNIECPRLPLVSFSFSLSLSINTSLFLQQHCERRQCLLD